MEWLAGRVDHDVRDAARCELPADRLAQVREDGDDAGRPAGEDAFDPAAARRPPALHLAEDDRQVVLPGHPLDAADDLERPLALELMEDHLEERRPRPRTRRSLVAVLADRGLDPATGLRGDIRAAVDDLRDGRHGHAGDFGDIGDRRRSGAAEGGCPSVRSRAQCSESLNESFATNVGVPQRDAPRFEQRIDNPGSATLQWPSRKYRRAFRNFRGGDLRPSGRPR